MRNIIEKILNILKKYPPLYDDGYPRDKKSVKRRKKNIEKRIKDIEKDEK